MNIEIKVISKSLAGRLQQAGEAAQQYYGERLLAYADKYTPFKTGTLKNTAVIDKDYIIYPTPYARMHWYGKKMIDPTINAAGFLTKDGWRSHKGVKKVKTDEDLDYDGAPLRGPFWMERMWIDKHDVITREVERVIARGFNR